MGGSTRCRRTLKYHYSGRCLAHLIGWGRGRLNQFLAVVCGRWACSSVVGGRGESSAPLFLELRRVSLFGVDPLTQVKDIVRWGVWLGRHIC